MENIAMHIQILDLEFLKSKLEYDPNTGLVRWLSPHPHQKQGWFHGTKYTNKYGYSRYKVGFNYREYDLHRLAWFYMTGAFPTGVIDHIDGDSLNNVFSNLRDVTRKQNSRNMKRAHKDNKTGYLGVHNPRNRGRYKATIWVDGEINLGYYNSPEEAHHAYLKAKEIYHS
jgi:HNH endonuclease